MDSRSCEQWFCRVMAVISLATALISLGGCSIPRVAVLGSVTAFDVPVMPKARVTKTSMNPFIEEFSPSNKVHLPPFIQVNLTVHATLDEVQKWYQSELSRRGWQLTQSVQSSRRLLIGIRSRWLANEE